MALAADQQLGRGDRVARGRTQTGQPILADADDGQPGLRAHGRRPGAAVETLAEEQGGAEVIAVMAGRTGK
jgi:hypothetical protein